MNLLDDLQIGKNSTPEVCSLLAVDASSFAAAHRQELAGSSTNPSTPPVHIECTTSISSFQHPLHILMDHTSALSVCLPCWPTSDHTRCTECEVPLVLVASLESTALRSHNVHTCHSYNTISSTTPMSVFYHHNRCHRRQAFHKPKPRQYITTTCHSLSHLRYFRLDSSCPQRLPRGLHAVPVRSNCALFLRWS